MKASSIAPSNYLTGKDMPAVNPMYRRGSAVKLTVATVDIQEFENGPMLVLTFEKTKKKLTLNSTRRNKMIGLYGDETDDWVGKEIKVYGENTMFRGQPMVGVRIEGVDGQMAQAPEDGWSNTPPQEEQAAPTGRLRRAFDEPASAVPQKKPSSNGVATPWDEF